MVTVSFNVIILTLLTQTILTPLMNAGVKQSGQLMSQCLRCHQDLPVWYFLDWVYCSSNKISMHNKHRFVSIFTQCSLMNFHLWGKPHNICIWTETLISHGWVLPILASNLFIYLYLWHLIFFDKCNSPPTFYLHEHWGSVQCRVLCRGGSPAQPRTDIWPGKQNDYR